MSVMIPGLIKGSRKRSGEEATRPAREMSEAEAAMSQIQDHGDTGIQFGLIGRKGIGLINKSTLLGR